MVFWTCKVVIFGLLIAANSKSTDTSDYTCSYDPSDSIIKYNANCLKEIPQFIDICKTTHKYALRDALTSFFQKSLSDTTITISRIEQSDYGFIAQALGVMFNVQQGAINNPTAFVGYIVAYIETIIKKKTDIETLSEIGEKLVHGQELYEIARFLLNNCSTKLINQKGL